MMDKIEKIAMRISSKSNIRTAGKIEFVKDQGPVRRDVRVKNFEWSPDSLRDLAKILWASQRAHSYAMAAFRVFSKMPSSEFSPDGLLGGRGYIQGVKDMRSDLSKTVEILSSFTDTIHDEINADHWSPVEKDADIDNIMDDTKSVKQNPDEYVDDEFKEEEDEPLVNPEPDNPEVYGDSEDEEDEDNQTRTSSGLDRYSESFGRVVKSRVAGGALDELLVPGMEPTITYDGISGPRAYPIGPSSGGEFGNFNDLSDQDGMWDLMFEKELLLDNGMFLPNSIGEGDGDNYKQSSYSMLPGSENLKSMNWYGLDVTEDDIKWMNENCKPGSDGHSLNQVEYMGINKMLWEKSRVV